MRDYGQVQVSFWGQSTALSDHAKLLALYLLTGPHSTGLGCFRLPDGYVVADLGWTLDNVQKAFAELFRNGFANRFEQVVFIPNFLRFNGIANPNVANARQKEFEALPDGEAKARVAGAMLTFGNHWPKGFETVLETVSLTVSKQEPNQNLAEPEPSRTKKRMSASRTARSPQKDANTPDLQFDEFKAAYPNRNGDKKWKRAREAINARLVEDHTWQEIMDGARRYAAYCTVTGDVGTRFVMQAATFCGPDKSFLETWEQPASKADVRLAANQSAGHEFMERTEERA